MKIFLKILIFALNFSQNSLIQFKIVHNLLKYLVNSIRKIKGFIFYCHMSYNIYFLHGKILSKANRVVNQQYHDKICFNFLIFSFCNIIFNFPTLFKILTRIFYISILLPNSIIIFLIQNFNFKTFYKDLKFFNSKFQIIRCVMCKMILQINLRRKTITYRVFSCSIIVIVYVRVFYINFSCMYFRVLKYTIHEGFVY